MLSFNGSLEQIEAFVSLLHLDHQTVYKSQRNLENMTFAHLKCVALYTKLVILFSILCNSQMGKN